MAVVGLGEEVGHRVVTVRAGSVVGRHGDGFGEKMARGWRW